MFRNVFCMSLRSVNPSSIFLETNGYLSGERYFSKDLRRSATKETLATKGTQESRMGGASRRKGKSRNPIILRIKSALLSGFVGK